MATRSRIGIQLQDDSILSVYHHWDGYPEWLGRILNTHYTTREQAAELIDGGDMSSCWNDDKQPEYYSARGENCPPRLDSNVIEYLNEMEEYAYVYTRNGEWVCFKEQYGDTPTKVAIPAGALVC
jgi:hypothetical protein